MGTMIYEGIALEAAVLMVLWDGRMSIMMWAVIVAAATVVAIVAIGYANSEGFR